MLSLKVPSWPVWLIGVGAGLAGLGAASALWTIGPGGLPPETLLRPDNLPRPVVYLLVAGVVGLVVLTVGLFAFVIRGSTSPVRAREGYASLGTILAIFAVSVILANVLTIPYGIIEGFRHPGEPFALSPGGLVLSVVALDGSLIAILYARIVRPGVLTWEQMGLTHGGLIQRIRLGVGAGVLVILVVAAIEAGLKAIGVQQTQADMFVGVKSATLGQFIGVLLAVAVIAPICEETFFRGYVFTAVSKTRGVPWAFASSSVLFAIAHLNLQAALPILVIGIAFSYLYWRSSSLVPSMVAHVMNNALAMTALYFYG